VTTAFDPPKHIQEEVIERMNESIGIDIGKRKCDVCVIDQRGNVLQRAKYPNTVADARTFAQKMADRYGRCRAACESTANMWRTTFDAFEDAEMEIKLANT